MFQSVCPFGNLERRRGSRDRPQAPRSPECGTAGNEPP